MNLLAPTALALLGLPPLVILLYFLKLKRRDRPVSTTYLWEKAIQDLRVNSPFQRLRRNLLLWLQLLLLALLILALARPVFNMAAQGGKQYICLIDTSASMGARDVRPSRMAAARVEVTRLIDDMTPDDRMMLITFDARPTVLLPLTGIKSRLREAAADIAARETGTDYAQAIDLVLSLAREMHNVELYLISDGAFACRAPGNAAGVTMHYVRVGASAANIGITAVDARRGLDDWNRPQVFARIENFGPTTEDVRVDLYLNDLLFDARTVAVAPGAGGGAVAVFSDKDLKEGTVRIDLAHDDHLEADNHAWLHLTEPGEAKTLIVTDGNYFLELAAMKDPLCAPVFMKCAEFEAKVAAGGVDLREYDVVVFDRHSPVGLPPGSYLFLGALPPLEGFACSGEAKQPTVIDWDSVHPVNQYVSYANLFLEKAMRVTAPRRAETLVDSTAGPLVVSLASESHRLVVVGFDMFASRWPLRVGFPVFFANAIRHLASPHESRGVCVRPGKVISFDAPPGVESVSVMMPDGGSATVPVQSGRVTFSQTGTCGPYRFQLDGEHARSYFVNLTDARESAIAPAETIPWEETAIAGTHKAVKENREFWAWLALAGLTVLMVEWYIYNRRVYL